MFISGKVRFSWTPSDYSSYDVRLTRDESSDAWDRVSDTQYTVKHVLLYDSITINVRTPGSAVENRITYNGSDVFLLHIYIVWYNIYRDNKIFE